MKIDVVDVKEFFLSQKYNYFMFAMCILYTLTGVAKLDATSVLKNVVIFGSIPVVLLGTLEKKKFPAMLKFIVLAIGIQLISWGNSLLVIPEYAKNYPEIKHLLALFLFFFIAIWVNTPKRRIILFGAFIASFVCTALYDIAVNATLIRGFNGERIDYGMHNAQFTSMLSAVVLILLFYGATVLKIRNKASAMIVSGGLGLFALFSLVASQSRQVWLAVIIVMGCAPLLCYSKNNIQKILMVYGVAFVCLLGVLQIDIVNKRVFAESNVIEKLATGDLQNIPMTSIGIRVNSWIEASEWIKRHPILGTDKNSVSAVLKTSKKFQKTGLSGYGHLHNYYLEILVAYGLVGLAFVYFFYKHVAVNIFAHHRGREKMLFVIFMIFWLIINCFESYNAKALGLYTQNIILAGLYTYLPLASNQDE